MTLHAAITTLLICATALLALGLAYTQRQVADLALMASSSHVEPKQPRPGDQIRMPAAAMDPERPTLVVFGSASCATCVRLSRAFDRDDSGDDFTRTFVWSGARPRSGGTNPAVRVIEDPSVAEQLNINMFPYALAVEGERVLGARAIQDLADLRNFEEQFLARQDLDANSAS